MRQVTVMTVTPENKRSGKVDLKRYCRLGYAMGASIIVLPSSFLPYYRNSDAFYSLGDIDLLPDVLKSASDQLRDEQGDMLVIVGVNEQGEDGKRFKTVVSFDGKGIVSIHRKHNLESHYIEKGFSVGDVSHPFDWNGIRILALECYETMYKVNWWPGCDLVVGSIGFGMRAKTDNYDCDYFDEWMTVLQAGAIMHNCHVIVSCNGQHKDFMTGVINRYGQVIGLARNIGMVVQDLELDEVVPTKQIYEEFKKL